MRALAVLAALSTAAQRARAEPEPEPTAPQLVPAPPPSDADRLRSALSRFEFGDYEAVVSELAALVERGAQASTLPRGDWLEALRAYGISCVLVGRPTAAEGAFSLLIEADPTTRLDPQLVRPEAVAVFDRVRSRHVDALLRAYRKGRRKRYAILNLFPPAGQLQNRQYQKGYALLGVELALLGLNLTSGSLLYAWRGDHQDFPGHEDTARALRPVNWVSFGALISVVVYGIIDGFVVGHRQSVEERAIEDQFRRGETPRGIRLSLSQDGVGVRF